MTVLPQAWQRSNHVALFAAGGLVLLFLVTLHPGSSYPGGLLFLLTGWAIPSLINLLLSWWLVSVLPLRLPMRMLLVLPVSLLLGLNIALPDTVRLLLYRPEITATVTRPLAAGPQRTLEGRPDMTAMGLVADPLQPALYVGSNEGCMCMYFSTEPARRYPVRMAGILRDHVQRLKAEAAHPSARNRQPVIGRLAGGYTVDGDPVKFTVEIHEGEEMTARFEHRNVPRDGSAYGGVLADRALTADFLGRSAHILLRNSVWALLLPYVLPTYTPEAQFRAFLDAALVPAP